MSLVESLISQNKLWRYGDSLFDAQAPHDFLCPLSKGLIREPVSVNCGGGPSLIYGGRGYEVMEGNHIFEGIEIEKWLSEQSTCPQDGNPVTEVGPHPFMKTILEEWYQQHLVKPIEPEILAHRLLYGETTDAYLRFARAANLMQEVAISLTRMIQEDSEDGVSLAIFR